MLKPFLSFVFAALIGQEAHAAVSYADAVSLEGDTVRVSGRAAEHIKGEGLAEILMQAAATPVVKNGVQVGYRLTDIQPGVFPTVGIREGDIVLEVDGMTLDSPQRAVEILRYAKGLQTFDVRLIRGKAERLLHVIVSD